MEIERKRKLRSAAAPFTTSTLQQEAVRKLGFSTDRAMKVAQSLYEGVTVGKVVTGLITYMRTDSVTLSNEAVAEMRGFITKNYGAEYLPKAPVVYTSKSKNAQEAHEAIRPTSIARHAGIRRSLPDRRAAQALRDDLEARHRLANDTRQIRYRGRGLHRGGAGNVFRATGQTMVFPGFYAVYHEDQDECGRRRGQAPARLRQGRYGEIEKALRRAALHPAAAALSEGEPGEGAGAIRHRAPFDVRLDHLDAR
jgi:DNA topoisomerase-1